MREVTVDSVVINHLLRQASGSAKKPRASSLEVCVRERRIAVGVDPASAIIDEWKRTAGAEAVEVLVTAWFECGGLFTVTTLGKIPTMTSRRLRQLGFKDTIDKLLVRVALVLQDRIVITEDSDFWNPRSIRSRGCSGRRAPVATLLLRELGVVIYTMRQFDRS